MTRARLDKVAQVALSAGRGEQEERLLELLRPLAYRWALVWTANPDLAEDVAQAVLLRVHESLPKYSPIGSFTAWAYRITRNVMLDGEKKARRDDARLKVFFRENLEARLSGRPHDTDLHGAADHLRRLMTVLSPQQRAVVDLVVLQGFTASEVAGMLDISPATVRVHLHRAKVALKRQGPKEVRMSENSFLSILSEGLMAADSISEVRDAEGHVARIDRHRSYPGAKRVYLDPPASGVSIQAQWQLPPIAIRPEFYPEGVPFIPAISGHVIESERGFMATWRDDSPGLDSDELVALGASLPPELSELAASMKKSSAQGRERAAEFVAGFKAATEGWSESDVEALSAGVSSPGVIDGRFVEAFQTALIQMAETGWIEEPVDEVPSYALQMACLVKDDRKGQLVLSSTFGVGSLTLTHAPLKSLEAAPARP